MEQIRNLSGSFEYKKAKGSGYMFNDNGSLVADKCRGIAYITYDFNNNPRQIYFTNGSVTKYVYSASGRKLRVVHYTAVPNITRTWGVKPPELTLAQILLSDSVDYLLGGSMVMKNGRVDKYLFEGGYAQASVAGSTTDNFSFFYYNRDHLGSIREVVDANGNIRQVTNYYPFGAPYADSPVNPDHQPYKYNGKELDRMHGLDTYDYGARQYDPILARWDRMDPLCEKTPGISPYNYCNDNPVKNIDPDGKEKKQYLKRDENVDEVERSDYSLYPDNTPGVLNIWAHGTYSNRYDEFAWGIQIGDNKYVSEAQEFQDAILSTSSEWKNSGGKDMIIVLHSCGTSEFAKMLSGSQLFKGKNITFIAPNARITVSKKGSRIKDKTFYKDKSFKKIAKIEKGKWMSYKDGELVGTDSATAQPGMEGKKEREKKPSKEKNKEDQQ